MPVRVGHEGLRAFRWQRGAAGGLARNTFPQSPGAGCVTVWRIRGRLAQMLSHTAQSHTVLRASAVVWSCGLACANAPPLSPSVKCRVGATAEGRTVRTSSSFMSSSRRPSSSPSWPSAWGWAGHSHLLSVSFSLAEPDLQACMLQQDTAGQDTAG